MLKNLLGHMSPVATHFIAFVLGFSLLFANDQDDSLGPWKGILVTLSRKQFVQAKGDQVFLIKKSKKIECLVSRDPYYFHNKKGESPSLLLPRKLEMMILMRDIIAGKIRLVSNSDKFDLCPVQNQVEYG